MSAAASFKPLAATDQNGSDDWPCVTTSNLKSRCATAPPSGGVVVSPSSSPVHAAAMSANNSTGTTHALRFIPFPLSLSFPEWPHSAASPSLPYSYERLPVVGPVRDGREEPQARLGVPRR